MRATATRLYPFERREPFEGARGQIELVKENCTFCRACARRCPTAAINVDKQGKIFYFEPFRCIICEACVEVCPRDGLRLISQWRSPDYIKSRVVVKGNGGERAANQ